MEVDFITLRRENAPVLTFGEVSNSSHFKGDCHDVSRMFWRFYMNSTMLHFVTKFAFKTLLHYMYATDSFLPIWILTSSFCIAEHIPACSGL